MSTIPKLNPPLTLKSWVPVNPPKFNLSMLNNWTGEDINFDPYKYLYLSTSLYADTAFSYREAAEELEDIFQKLKHYLKEDCKINYNQFITDPQKPFSNTCNTIEYSYSSHRKEYHFRIFMGMNVATKIPKVSIQTNTSKWNLEFIGKTGQPLSLFRRVQAALDYLHRGVADGHFDSESIE